jgi:hypothetical protein
VHRSPRLRVVAPSPCQLGAWGGLDQLPPAAAPVGDHQGVTKKGFDRRGDSANFPQPRGSASSPARGSCGDVFGAKLPHSPLLFQTEWRRGPCSGAKNSDS